MTNLDLTELLADSRAIAGTAHGYRVMLFSHDTLGLGHLYRNLKIAAAIRQAYPEITIMMATGSHAVSGFHLPQRVDYIKLPAVKKIGAGEYDSLFSDISFAEALKLRQEILLTTVKEYNPHILVVDHSPLGMKKDILPALRWIKKNNENCRVLMGLRDIIDDPPDIREAWSRDSIYDILAEFYDYIFVYGQKQIFNLIDSYGFPDALRSKTAYIGYVADNGLIYSSEAEDYHIPQDRDFVLVTIGGGEWMGQTIIGNFLEMLDSYQEQIDFASVVLTGPFVQDDLWKQFQKKSAKLPARLIRFVPQTRRYLERSSLVISTAGYNSVVDLLSYAKRALIIPRIMFRKEQIMRAQAFSGLGLFDYMHPDQVTSDALFEMIGKMLSGDDEPLKRNRSKGLINLNGAGNMADIIGKLVSSVQAHKGRK